MRRLLLAFFISLLAVPLHALDANEMFDDPAMEERAREIGRQLRCLKCRNQSIFDSNAGIAKDLRVVVRERMVAGDSDDEILTFVQERFGDYVLMKPPVAANTYGLWLAPILLIGLGGLSTIFYLRGRTRQEAMALTEEERLEAQRILNSEGRE